MIPGRHVKVIASWGAADLIVLRLFSILYLIRVRQSLLFHKFATEHFDSLAEPATGCHNHLGSGALVTDGAGNEVFRITYTEYGEIDLTNSGKHNPATGEIEHHLDAALIAITAVKYTGQQYSIEEEMYYYGARHYDPTIGVFVSADTIIDFSAGNLGFNRYMYVAGNPVRFSDPTGHNIFDEIGDWVSKAWEDTKKWVSDNAKAIKTAAAVIFNPMAAINAGVAMWAGVNAYVHAKTGNWLTADQGWDAFGAGAQAGAIAAAAAGAGGIGGLGGTAIGMGIGQALFGGVGAIAGALIGGAVGKPSFKNWDKPSEWKLPEGEGRLKNYNRPSEWKITKKDWEEAGTTARCVFTLGLWC